MEINKNYNESNLETMAKMPDNFIDLIITSPPYDNLREYKGYSFPFEEIAKELFRITKQGGVVVWVIGDSTINGSESGTSFKQALFFKEIGFNLHDTMIYAKKNFIPLTHRRYEQQFEYIFILSKGKLKTFNPILEKTIRPGEIKNYKAVGSNVKEGGYRRRNQSISTKDTKIHTNIFWYSTGNNLTKHPAPFPEQLAHNNIISWSNEGDLIYDPFMGSGTVAKMAIANKRNWIGSEISKEYCDIIEQRIK
jgi:DNA modification methylase